jgi:hypothetical protein
MRPTTPITLALLGLGLGTAPSGISQASAPTDPVVTRRLAEARALADGLQGEIRTLLVAELTKGGAAGAVRVCSQDAPARIAAYRERTGADIRRVSLRRRNPANEPDASERQALEAFDRLSVEARPAAEHWELVREGGRETLLYLRPLVANAMCLSCHGVPSAIPPAVKEALAASYPGDRATGYASGDVRGAVSVRLPLPAR